MRIDRQTDKHNERNSRFFAMFANASKNESSSQDCFQDYGEKKIAPRQT